MSSTLAAVSVCLIILLSGGEVSVAPGATLAAPHGFVTSNIDPTLNSSLRDQIYDANFIPGFAVGLTNVSVTWSSRPGRGDVGYSIGPWAQEEAPVPHLAVGPQCCNFLEVPHTQQFRLPAWGDYNHVRAGFGAPGVNVQNYTSDFRAPAYVGLRTDWNWTVQLSLRWSPPVSFDPSNEWAEIGIAATQYVPNATGKLVYTVVDFWMDQNSSSRLSQYPDGTERQAVGQSVVVYHPVQLSTVGNQTITLNLSPYLSDTLRTLGLPVLSGRPPVVSYVYLNVEGYNFRWNTSIWAMRVMTPGSTSLLAPQYPPYLAVVAGLAAVASLLAYRFRAKRGRPVGPAGARP